MCGRVKDERVPAEACRSAFQDMISIGSSFLVGTGQDSEFLGKTMVKHRRRRFPIKSDSDYQGTGYRKMHAVSMPRAFIYFGWLSWSIFATNSCTRHSLTDEQLTSIFREKRPMFDRVLHESLAPFQGCEFKQTDAICIPKDERAIKQWLAEGLGIQIEDVYINRNLGNSLWIPIETHGHLSISSWTRGYVHCICALSPETKDTLQAYGNGNWYRPLGNGWRIYVAY